MILMIFLFRASQEKWRTGKPQLGKAAAPSGAHSKAYCDGRGWRVEGDGLCFISWSKGHKHHSDSSIIGLCDFLFTLLNVSSLSGALSKRVL